jgi:TonB family protein
MNIQCETCSARYSIADDAIAGGMYQVRCQRCASTFTIQAPGLSGELGSHRLRDQRNENSLLFAARDLAPPASAEPAPSAPGREGSGLLDIRRIARAYTERPESPSQARTPQALDEWASITPVGQVLPHLVPARPATSSTSPVMWALTGIASLVAVVAVALGLLLVKNELGTRAATPGMPAESATSPEPETTTAVAALDRRAGDPERETAADATARTEPAPQADEPARDRTERKPRQAEKTEKAEKAARTEKAQKTEKAEKVARAEKTPKTEKTAKTEKAAEKAEQRLDEVGCLLAAEPPAYCQRYLKASRPDKQRADESRGDLPARPSQDAIRQGMDKVRAAVTACGGSHPGGGQVTLSIKVGSDGDIASVSVKNSPSDALGRCVAGAARKASFPASQQGITFSYPFMFR